MLKRSLALAFALAAPLLVHSAVAGELTMFEHDNFQGRSVTVREDARTLDRLGLNDKVSSLVVRSGRWQVCEHANFEGRCGIFEAGEYAQLNRERLGDTISSVREVGGDGRNAGAYGDQRDGYRDGGDQRDGYRDRGEQRDGYRDGGDERRERRHRRERAEVELFTGAEFRGDRVVVEEDQVNSLSRRNFNDRAKSLVVRGGEWQVCVHDNFGGECAVYGPGKYPRLGRLSGQISSIRQVR